MPLFSRLLKQRKQGVNELNRLLDASRIVDAVELIEKNGAHLDAWLIDQILQILLGPGYRAWVDEYNKQGSTPWYPGIAPWMRAECPIKK